MVRYHPFQDRATAIANKFLSRVPNTSTHFLCLQRDKVGNGLLDRIVAPHLIQQGPAGLCGPASLLFDLASRDPETYAKFVISLFENGSGRIRNLEVKPNRALKIALTPANMDQVDWLTMASIRNSENTIFFDYDAPSGNYNQFTGMTLPGEMKGWLKKAGYTEVVDETSTTKFLSMSSDNAREASSKYEDDWEVFLFIGAEMLNFHTEHESSTLPNHWVKLMSKIDLKSHSVKFKVYSWGQGNRQVPGSQSDPPPPGVERQGNHSFTEEMFLKNYYGYIAARF